MTTTTRKRGRKGDHDVVVVVTTAMEEAGVYDRRGDGRQSSSSWYARRPARRFAVVCLAACALKMWTTEMTNGVQRSPSIDNDNYRNNYHDDHVVDNDDDDGEDDDIGGGGTRTVPVMEGDGRRVDDGRGPRNRHPRVTCLDPSTTSCLDIHTPSSSSSSSKVHPDIANVAISQPHHSSSKSPPTQSPMSATSDDIGGDHVHSSETETCKFSDASYQALHAAPSTCNDVHAISFDFDVHNRRSRPLVTRTGRTTSKTRTNATLFRVPYPSDHITSYLTHGGYREVFAIAYRNDEHERVILKTNRVGKKGWSAYLLDKYRRDILVSERAGTSPAFIFPSARSGVCPVYQYCAFTSVSPHSDVGPLDKYVTGRKLTGTMKRDAGEGTITTSTSLGMAPTNTMEPTEIYVLAMQAARGLYQAHLYRDGRATNVHADIKPDQFLLFRRGTVERDVEGRQRRRRKDGPSADDNDDDEEESTMIAATTGTITTRAVLANPNVPILQIQDFNRGRYLTRSIVEDGDHNDDDIDTTCPFRMCGIKHRASTYRSPEEYMDCADQSYTIDVYALGGVFYYLLSDGRRPWYYVEDYDLAVERILGGEKSSLPNEIPEEEEEEELGEGVIAGDEEFEVDAPSRRERSRHPALAALREIMMKCWEFKPEDRPSSLQVVQMLEEKWNDVIAPTISSGGI